MAFCLAPLDLLITQVASCAALRHAAKMWLTLLVMIAGGQISGAQQDRFEASLQAGEFTTAVQLAKAEVDPGPRRTQFRKIVSLQEKLGERGAMFHTLAQQPGLGGLPGLGQAAGQGTQNGLPQASAGVAGGGTQADFDPLIELITSTIEPETWTEVGGPGAIDEFAGGVFVDINGLLQRTGPSHKVTARAAAPVPPPQASDKDGPARKIISLPRLERAVQRELAMGRPIPYPMKWLGIKHIEYVCAYPETGELVIVGPQCAELEEGLSLSDLVIVWHSLRSGAAEFGCSIDPIPQHLAAAQRYLDSTAGIAIKPTQRSRWLRGLRDTVGEQNVRVFGVDADSSTARIMVEADYHMKLVGIGLEPAPPGIVNYLQSVKLRDDGSLPPLELLRWWFTLSDAAVESTDDGFTFMMPEQTVRVLSENELVNLQGVRQPTGASTPANSAFAASFSEHFLELADVYPIYARLRTIFDLAFALSTIEANDLTAQVHWQPTLMVNPDSPLVESSRNARRVQTVINHRVIAEKHIVAAVSGGVVVKPNSSVMRYVMAESPQLLHTTRQEASPPDDPLLWYWH